MILKQIQNSINFIITDEAGINREQRESKFVKRSGKEFRYRQLAKEIEREILSGNYQAGERLPSIRRLHRRTNLSISTIYQAYVELETMGLVEARPRSGYFVSPVTLQQIKVPIHRKRSIPPREIQLSSVINSVVTAINDTALLPLGMTVIDAEMLPFKALSRILKATTQRQLKDLLSYALSEGSLELKRRMAHRYLGVVEAISEEDIIITNGCMEAVALCLLATVTPGGTVAVEAPTNFTFLQMLKELGLMVAEVPTDPQTGLEIQALERLIRRTRIDACLFMPNFHNPLGALMPDSHKAALVRLLNRRGIPLIEDDISAELHFGHQRPLPLKAFDRDNLVLTCSSFSKTLAPGLRIGWVLPGSRFRKKIQNLKAGTTVSTSSLDQHVIAQFIGTGSYERHLRRLRAALGQNMIRTAMAVQKHFPEDTRLSVPEGGSLLWVQLPPGIDGLDVHQKALARHIAVIPGVVCSNSGLFKNHIQISFGMPFTPVVEEGIATLGEMLTEMS
jgi:DNA-binding transcriptional MocR family regulator